MVVDIKWPLELIEEDLRGSKVWTGQSLLEAWAMARTIQRVFGTQGIIKIVAEIGKPVRITRYKREGE
jgi:hypothetical protein